MIELVFLIDEERFNHLINTAHSGKKHVTSFSHLTTFGKCNFRWIDHLNE